MTKATPVHRMAHQGAHPETAWFDCRMVDPNGSDIEGVAFDESDITYSRNYTLAMVRQGPHKASTCVYLLRCAIFISPVQHPLTIE